MSAAIDYYHRGIVMPEMERIYHTWDKWECYPAGFYEVRPPKGMEAEECELAYRDFLADLQTFKMGLHGVITTWMYSCEHYLTNQNMNRIAWLGQAACCYVLGIPSRFRGGYNLLTKEQQAAADQLALEYLNKWRFFYNQKLFDDLKECESKTKVDLY